MDQLHRGSQRSSAHIMASSFASTVYVAMAYSFALRFKNSIFRSFMPPLLGEDKHLKQDKPHRQFPIKEQFLDPKCASRGQTDRRVMANLSAYGGQTMSTQHPLRYVLYVFVLGASASDSFSMQSSHQQQWLIYFAPSEKHIMVMKTNEQ